MINPSGICMCSSSSQDTYDKIIANHRIICNYCCLGLSNNFKWLRYGFLRRNYMKTIFIGSTGTGSGRSLMAWFLAEQLMSHGLKAGFIKPLHEPPPGDALGKEEDPDLALMDRILGEELVEKRWHTDGAGQAYLEASQGPSEKLQNLRKRFEKADVCLIMGSQKMFSDFSLSPIPDTKLVKEFQAQMCLMDHYENVATSIYSILSIHSLLKGTLKTVVINRAPPEEVDAIRDRLVPLLTSQGIPAVAVLPEDQVLSSLSLKKIQQALSAQVLMGEELLGVIVGGYTLGG